MSRKRRWLAMGVGAVSLWTMTLGATAVLFDFENDAEVQPWHDGHGGQGLHDKELTRSPAFATSGAHALRFTTAQWVDGASEWPSFETQAPLTDWSGYDRLVIDLTNASAGEQKIGLYLADGTRSASAFFVGVPPRSHRQVEVKLTEFFNRSRIDATQMKLLHLHTERPPVPLEVFIDRIALLTPDETLPDPPDTFRRQLVALQLQEFDTLAAPLAAGKALAAAQTDFHGAFVLAAIAELEERLAAWRQQVEQGQNVENLAAGLVETRRELQRLAGLLEFRRGFETIRATVQTGATGDNLAAGFADSMEKVAIRGPLLPVKTATGTAIALAGNEWQSFQIAVTALHDAAEAVEVRIGELRRDDGTVFPADAVQVAPIGYVKTDREPPYASAYVGWWPDLLLDFQPNVPIARDDVQSFWVKFHAPPAQPAGIYRGTAEVWADGMSAFRFDLTVRVFDFTLPATSPLPTAITFRPRYAIHRDGVTEEGDYRDTSWRDHRFEWVDFLADYFITYDDLYLFWDNRRPDFEALERLHEQGRLGRFSLGYVFPCGSSEAEIAAWRQRTLEEQLRPNIEQARALGILDHAYIFGCDEAPEALWADVERAAAQLKAEFPEVPFLTTVFDHSFGAASVIASVDTFVPATYHYDPAKVAAARERGKQVWWYFACGPTSPFANMFLECPAIEGRLIMGAMAAKYRPDGFLYFQISMWNSPRPVTTGPFTDWISGFSDFNGDGSWVAPGPDGKPLSSIRLENFRAGLQDLAYVRLLEEACAAVRTHGDPADQPWLQAAEAALTVPATLVRSLSDYSRDPAELQRWRTGLAELLEQTPTRP